MNDAEWKKLVFPDDILVIDDVEVLRIVADPLRLRMLELLRREPATAKQLAQALNVPLKKLYYHINLLEEHKLIRVTGTNIVSGIIEKQYQVTAYRLSVARSLLAASSTAPTAVEGIETLLSFLLGHTESEIRKSLRAGLIDPSQTDLDKGGLVLGRVWMHLTPQQASELKERIHAVIDEFAHQQATSNDSEGRYYELLTGFYPVLEPPNSGEDGHRGVIGDE
jgi:DNA-binding transcriptional ArsR family regulator